MFVDRLGMEQCHHFLHSPQCRRVRAHSMMLEEGGGGGGEGGGGACGGGGGGSVGLCVCVGVRACVRGGPNTVTCRSAGYMQCRPAGKCNAGRAQCDPCGAIHRVQAFLCSLFGSSLIATQTRRSLGHTERESCMEQIFGVRQGGREGKRGIGKITKKKKRRKGRGRRKKKRRRRRRR